MNNIQLPFLVEALLIVIAGLFGFLLRRKGRPYGWGKLITHLFFYVWLTVGYGYVVYSLTISPVPAAIWYPALLMGAAVVAQVATGIALLAKKGVRMGLIRTHLTSAVVMVISSLASFVVAGFMA